MPITAQFHCCPCNWDSISIPPAFLSRQYKSLGHLIRASSPIYFSRHCSTLTATVASSSNACRGWRNCGFTITDKFRLSAAGLSHFYLCCPFPAVCVCCQLPSRVVPVLHEWAPWHSCWYYPRYWVQEGNDFCGTRWWSLINFEQSASKKIAGSSIVKPLFTK